MMNGKREKKKIKISKWLYDEWKKRKEENKNKV